MNFRIIFMVLSRDSSIRIASRSSGNDIGPESWYAVAGGEAGYIEADPTNADITYGGEYDGQLSSFKKKNRSRKDISPIQNRILAPSSAKKYRFQWTYQLFSPHNPKKNVCYLSGGTRDRRSRSFI
jgi:hypothetical protein